MRFFMGSPLYQFFNLAVAPAMNAALGEEAFVLGREGKVEGDFVGRVSSWGLALKIPDLTGEGHFGGSN